jgi:hypothetical protein
VLAAARRAHRPVVILCGQAAIEPEGVPVRSLVREVGRERAFRDTARALEEVTADLARSAERLAGSPA